MFVTLFARSRAMSSGLVVTLLLALLVRVPGIPYGLPLHLYGDEEVNIYSALTMLEVQTLLPVLHTDAFVPLLYEPPVTAYLFALAFVPTLTSMYVVAGLPALSAFTYSLILDPSILWYVARCMSVIASVMNVALIYTIGRRLFKSERAGLFAALFLSFSFIDVSIAATARHWEFGILFSLVSVWLALRAFDVASPRRWSRLAVAGAVLGTAVGTVYVALLAPLVGLIVLQESGWRFWQKEAVSNLTVFSISSFGVAALWILVHPYPLFTQTATSSALTGDNTILDFITYYGTTLLEFDTPLVIAAIVGLTLMVWDHHRRGMVLAASAVLAFVCMYTLLPNIARYVVSVVPLLALCAGYAADTLLVRTTWRHTERVVFLAGGLYMLVLFGRYEQLIIHNDTRLNARAWIMESVPRNASVLIDSDVIKVPSTTQAIQSVEHIAPEMIRAGDRAILSGAHVGVQFYAYPLFVKSQAARSLLVQEALARNTETYLVVDAWSSPPTGYGTIAATPVLAFTGQQLDPPYLVQGGQPVSVFPQHIIGLLYSVDSLGPTVSISTVVEKKK